MTVLVTKENRDLIGIDSYEKAIVWSSCSLLSAINTQSATYDKNYSVSADQESSKILISFGMPLNMSLFWSSMGDPDLSLKNITELTPTYEGEYLPITTPIEVEPSSINTLEKYFVWANKKLLEHYLKNEPTKSNNVLLSTDLKRSALFVTTSLDYDPIVYSESDSLLKAVIASSLVSNYSSLIGNNILFGNNYLVGN